MKKQLVILLYSTAMLLGLGTSVWRLTHPTHALAQYCGGTSCWTSSGGANWLCTDNSPNCPNCDGNYCQSSTD